MYCYHGIAIKAPSGGTLADYYVECLVGNTVQPIYADNAGSPIASLSGAANRAKTDADGNFFFFVADGTYDLRYYSTATSTVPVKTETSFTMDAGSAALRTDLLASTGAGLSGFTQSGTGAVAETVQTALRKITTSTGYDTAANFRTATAALTSTIGVDSLHIGDPTAFGYAQDDVARLYYQRGLATGIQHSFRVISSGKGDNTTYRGIANAYFEARDDATVVAGTKGVLYALSLSVVPSVARNNVPFDDAVCLTISNTTGVVGAKATDAIYISNNTTAFGDRVTGTSEWYSLFTADCNADVGFAFSGKIATYAIDLKGANLVLGSAIRFPNNAYLVARNAGDTANLNLIGLDGNNTVRLGGANTQGVQVTSTWFGATAPTVVTTGTYTVLATDNDLIVTSTCTVTLPAAGSFPGRWLTMKSTGLAVTSATSNVAPLAGGAAGTAILPATAGKWARLVSDGAVWHIMAGN